MVSRKTERNGSVYTESNYSSDENEECYDENDSDYSPSNKMAKISTNYYSGGKGKSLSPFCLDKQFQHGQQNNSQMSSRRGPRPKCSSRNALMARENRIRKKMYMESLERKLEKYGKENKELNGLIGNQSCLIADLRKEVKYLKNVLANSSDITRLLKGIQRCTGMPVTTSLNKDLTVKVDSCKEKSEDSSKSAESVDEHPWLDENISQNNNNFSLTDSFFESQEYSPLLLQEQLFSEDFPEMPELTDNIDNREQLEEHNYTAKYDISDDSSDGSAGICLHIAKHKVSLEFCSDCNQRATDTWNQVDEGQE